MPQRYTATITQASDGTWAWTLVDRHQVSVDRGHGYATHQAAEHAAAASRQTLQRILAGQLRDDGEDITGYWDVDLDNSR